MIVRHTSRPMKSASVNGPIGWFMPSFITVWVSNSLSGGDRELDEVPAVGDPAHLAQIGRGHGVSTGERQRRVALQ